jgi:hypothetical protein
LQLSTACSISACVDWGTLHQRFFKSQAQEILFITEALLHNGGFCNGYITTQCLVSSVADPGCLSRMPDPDFHPSRIPNPKTETKERGEIKFVVIPFL